jgi:glucan biosynthesis protein C
MLLLGIVLHGAQAYLGSSHVIREPDRWYFYDVESSRFMAFVCGAIHVYRMPVFFVLAGFFAGLLISKRGLRGLIYNRFSRVVIPFAVALLTIVPAIFAAQFLVDKIASTRPDVASSSTFPLAGLGGLHHLWFLWHLILFYALTVFAIVCARTIVRPQTGIHRVSLQLASLGDRIFNSGWGTILFCCISLFFLAPMKTTPGSIDSSFGVLPHSKVLGIYALCYAYGLLLFRNRGRLEQLNRGAQYRIGFAIAALGTYLGLLGWALANQHVDRFQWALIGLGSLALWTMVEGWLALFQVYFSAPNRLLRYLSDASYWIYLVHVPVMLLAQGALANISAPALVKFSLATLLTAWVCVTSYHFLVRNTFMGELLNGRRYPVNLRWRRQKSIAASKAES